MEKTIQKNHFQSPKMGFFYQTPFALITVWATMGDVSYGGVAVARCCDVSGTQRMMGNIVSHAHNKTRRAFLPNLHTFSVFSRGLGRRVSLRLSQSGLKTIEKFGGLDEFLEETPYRKLCPELGELKRELWKRAVQKCGGLDAFLRDAPQKTLCKKLRLRKKALGHTA